MPAGQGVIHWPVGWRNLVTFADETDLPHPLSPYGASKLAGEAYCQAYAATYGIAACALRFSNAYGPYSLHKKSVVAAWLRAAIGGGRSVAGAASAASPTVCTAG